MNRSLLTALLDPPRPATLAPCTGPGAYDDDDLEGIADGTPLHGDLPRAPGFVGSEGQMPRRSPSAGRSTRTTDRLACGCSVALVSGAHRQTLGVAKLACCSVWNSGRHSTQYRRPRSTGDPLREDLSAGAALGRKARQPRRLSLPRPSPQTVSAPARNPLKHGQGQPTHSASSSAALAPGIKGGKPVAGSSRRLLRASRRLSRATALSAFTSRRCRFPTLTGMEAGVFLARAELPDHNASNRHAPHA
jgi:hypothetical protein